jgi:hypothetical protein
MPFTRDGYFTRTTANRPRTYHFHQVPTVQLGIVAVVRNRRQRVQWTRLDYMTAYRNA